MTSDKILISNIDCVAAIGVTAAERATPQHLVIDVEFAIDCRRPAKTDGLEETIDYAVVAAAAAEVCAAREYNLVETLAERIAERVLAGFPTPWTRVLVRKISPIAAPTVRYVAVEIVRP